MNTLKIRKGDTVQVMIGKDKGKKGEVMKVIPLKNMVLVENVNQYKRHVKSRMQGQKSEIVTVTKPLHVSKVSLIDPKKKKPTRAGYKIVKPSSAKVSEGQRVKKERISRMSGEKI